MDKCFKKIRTVLSQAHAFAIRLCHKMHDYTGYIDCCKLRKPPNPRFMHTSMQSDFCEMNVEVLVICGHKF